MRGSITDAAYMMTPTNSCGGSDRPEASPSKDGFSPQWPGGVSWAGEFEHVARDKHFSPDDDDDHRDELMTEPTPDASTGAPAGAPANQEVDEHDLLVLARIAGLTVSEDRAAGLARELTTTLAAARELDAVLTNHLSQALGPYDPAWPDEPANGSGAAQ